MDDIAEPPAAHAGSNKPSHVQAALSLPSPPLTPTRHLEPNDTRSVSHSRLPIQQQSRKDKWDERIKEASCWADASSGPLIPYIQAHYHISYTVVSMLFVGQAVGFAVAAFANSFLTHRLGLGKVIALGAVIQACAYTLLIPAFPFPVFPVIYAISGFGMALQDAQANVYIATLPGAETKLGYLHGSYGLGAAVVPLAATAFASSGILFSRFYGISLGLAALNAALLVYAFRLSYVVDVNEPSETLEAPGVPPVTVVEGQEGIELTDQSRRDSTGATSVLEKVEEPSELEAGRVALREMDTRLQNRPKNRGVIVGAEVSMGGWIVTFMIDKRNGGPDAGYTATGFWFGLMLGRVLLNPINVRVGEKRVLYFYTVIALALEFAVWFADSLVGNAIVVAVIGVLIGPVYPVAISVLTKVIPRRLHATSIGFCASFGQIGAAACPFATGALAGLFSPAVLQPVMIVLFAIMLGLWVGVPGPARKKE
ncbi:MFS efflux transporter [Rhodotorula toruloides]|uniref:MFS efflux transporter n=1 Tax=Rhodotorula toruloides TaxID=5286 RepID=A0A511KEQ1_RHOTO|nr:MFS efflux transporter [Rhodotorula toruloides]